MHCYETATLSMYYKCFAVEKWTKAKANFHKHLSQGLKGSYTGMDKLVCTPASTALFACPSGSDCVQVIPAYPPGGDTSAGSFGNGRFLISTSFTNSRFVRCTCASLPYLQNKLPSLIISAILAQYSSLCDHLVLPFNQS